MNIITTVLFAAPVFCGDSLGFSGGPQELLGWGQEVHELKLADLDGDGRSDVVTLSWEDRVILWYRNQGAGAFETARLIELSESGVSCFALADGDGDGDIDVFVGGEESVRWFRNAGGGQFDDAVVLGLNQYWAVSIHLMDLDADGVLDLLVTRNDEIDSFAGLGGGQFAPPTNFVTLSSGTAREITSPDLDGDGDLDVLLDMDGGYVEHAWLENLGSGQFSGEQVLETYATRSTELASVDLDGDGDLDLLAAVEPDDGVVWYTNTGGGQFGPKQVISATVNGCTSVAAGDLDGDGDADVVTVAPDDGDLVLFVNQGGGTFGPKFVVDGDVTRVNLVRLLDVELDGDLDVIVSSPRDRFTVWYANDGTGAFASRAFVTPNPGWPWHTRLFDLDSDGDLDVVSSFTAEPHVGTFENFGAGRLGMLRAVPAGLGEVLGLAAGDLDADGIVDLVALPRADDRVLLLPGTGPWSFGTEQVIDPVSAIQAYHVEVADLDADGDPDILTAGQGLEWYRNDGAGVFAQAQSITTGALGDGEPSVADLDGDGLLDVLVLKDVPGSVPVVRWLRNLGNGAFVEEAVVAVLDDNRSRVVAGDVDGDQDLDLVLAHDRLRWLENLGGGQFGPASASIIGGLTTYRSAVVADVRGDGLPDVLVHRGNSLVQVDQEAGTGFSLSGIEGGLSSPITTSPITLRLGDLDGDGDDDLLASMRADNRIAWYENRTPLPGTPLCLGDGSGPNDCPCQNHSALGLGEGCLNSTGRGAVLRGYGNAVVAADRLELRVTGARAGQPCMLLQGTQLISLPFKDGILCAGIPTERIEILTLDSQGAAVTSNSVVERGHITGPGLSRYYQAWYRDPQISSCGTGSNFTSALGIVWI